MGPRWADGLPAEAKKIPALPPCPPARVFSAGRSQCACASWSWHVKVHSSRSVHVYGVNVNVNVNASVNALQICVGRV